MDSITSASNNSVQPSNISAATILLNNSRETLSQSQKKGKNCQKVLIKTMKMSRLPIAIQGLL